MAHINYYVDLTVEVFLVYKNKVLLRYHDKYNIWLSVGGHVEPNEDPNQAAIREVKEEVGMDIELFDGNMIYKNTPTEKMRELIPPYFMNNHKINETHRHTSMIYFAKTNTDKVVEEAPDKSGQFRWLTKEDLENMKDINENIKVYALKALELVS
jgi:8-oxo-dGTP pyrophosphatase MutT (NUDIX family)